MPDIEKLKKFVDSDNVATEIPDNDLQRIGGKVLAGFREDLNSMSEWLADVHKVEDLAALTVKTKNYPLPDSANIKFPLITKAVYEFASRTYPEIIKDGKVVKARVIGLDLTNEKSQRCERVSDFMNYQLLYSQDEWELELDRLLNQLGLIGFVCRKTWFDPVRKVIKSDICDYNDLIINSNIKSMSDARRISHVLHFRLNDLIEYSNSGLFLKEPVEKRIEQLKDDDLDPKIDLIEQHTYLDLDNDNYSEPYVVTVFKDSGEILRIVPRFTKKMVHKDYIDGINMFTDYHFLVSPKGKFHSVGFGILMLHLNETINTVLNQLIDAGKLANLQGGYKDSRLKNLGSGDSLLKPGEWITMKASAGVTIKDGMIPIMYKEPSNVLYQLLGLMIDAGKDLSSSSEVMTGASNVDNAKTGAVQALQAQGLKVFTAIQKRIYRSLTSELNRVYQLNSRHLDQKTYFNILDQPKVIMKDDFEQDDLNILPVADPNLSSDIQRASRNQLLIAAQQLPGTNTVKLTQLILENANLGIPIQEIMLPPEAMNKPDPNIIKIQADIENMAQDKKLEAEKIQIEQYRAQIDFLKAESLIVLQKAQAMLYVAQAQAQQDNGKFQEYQLQLDALSTHLDAVKDAANFAKDSQIHRDTMDLQHKQLQQTQAGDPNANPQQADQGVAGEPSDAPPPPEAQGA